MDHHRHIFKAVKIILAGLLSTLTLKIIFIPCSLGDFSFYWQESLKEWQETPMHFTATGGCMGGRCHPEEVERWRLSVHAGLGCETCHGSMGEHILNMSIRATMFEKGGSKGEKGGGIGEREAMDCLKCHGNLVGRPATFPQVERELHHPEKGCLDCHDPHSPVPRIAHPFPDDCKGGSFCLKCHKKGEGEPEKTGKGLPPIFEEVVSQPRISEDHGEKDCLLCHSPAPTFSELGRRVHGVGALVCERCHEMKDNGKGGVAIEDSP